MNGLQLMISIIEREHMPDFLSLYQEHNVEVNYISLAHGTAPVNMLHHLGLNDSEKAVLFSFAMLDRYKKIKKDLERKLKIDVPGRGIVFTVPLASIGGARELAFYTDGQDFTKGEESEMKDTKYELIMAICDRGYCDSVMETARTFGAGGGTIIHAQGTGRKKTEKFFGISLASEKDITFIVAPSKKKAAMMEAIMKVNGIDTKARTAVFSLPVTDIAGIRLAEQYAEEDEKAKEEQNPQDEEKETEEKQQKQSKKAK